MDEHNPNSPIVAYRRWKNGKISYIGSMAKKTEIVCVDCHNLGPNNDERDTYIVSISETGRSIKATSAKCAACGEIIRCKYT